MGRRLLRRVFRITEQCLTGSVNTFHRDTHSHIHTQISYSLAVAVGAGISQGKHIDTTECIPYWQTDNQSNFRQENLYALTVVILLLDPLYFSLLRKRYCFISQILSISEEKMVRILLCHSLLNVSAFPRTK